MMVQSLNRRPGAWSPGELTVLREHYPRGVAAVQAILPHRGTTAIREAARRYGIRKGPRYWTAAEDRQLRELWDPVVGTLEQIAARLNRTPLAVHQRAVKTLRLGWVPQGYETIRRAAQRAGVNYHTMRKLLRRGRVPLWKPFTHPGYRNSRATSIVDKFDVDEVIDEYCRTETVQQAAKRLGISRPTLLARLKRAGFKAPGRRRAWRVYDHQVRKALEAFPLRTR